MIQANEFSFDIAYQLLEKELKSGKKPLYDNPLLIPIKHISTAQSLLQPRGLNDVSSSEEHIKVLVKAIENNKPSHTLDPITVWWSGSCYRVIDGHHRLEAYKRVVNNKIIKIPLIPVQLFEGSLKQAILESTRLNSKDKLAMTSDDKFERAWRLVCLENYTIKETAIVCGIGGATVSRMRTKLAEFKTKFPDKWKKEVFSLTWKEAITSNKPKQDYDEAWEIKQGKEWAQRLHNTFGNKFSSQPRVAALALEYYAKNLIPSLIDEWRTQITEIYEKENWGDEAEF